MVNNDGRIADIFHETVPATHITLWNNSMTILQIMTRAGGKKKEVQL
jgi:hypothetical protein